MTGRPDASRQDAGPLAAGPSRSSAWRLRGCFVLLGALSAGWTVRIPAVKEKLSLTDGQLGLEVLGWGLATLAAMQFSATVLRRHGTSRVLAVALPVLALSLVPVGLASSFLQLVLAGVLFGVGYGLAEVAATTAASALEAAFDRPLMGGMHASWSIGAVAGGLLGALGAALELGFTTWMLILGSGGLLLALVLVARLPAAPRVLAPPPVPGPEHRASRLPRVLILYGIVVAAAYLAEGTVADWSGVYLVGFTGTSQAVAALAYPLTEGVVIGARLLADRLPAGSRYAVIVVAAASIAAIGFLVTSIAPVWWVALGGFLLVGGSIGVLAPLTLSGGARLAPDRRAAAVARLSTLGYAGFLLGPVVIGSASQTWTLATALLVAGGVCLLAVAAALLIGTSSRR